MFTGNKEITGDQGEVAISFTTSVTCENPLITEITSRFKGIFLKTKDNIITTKITVKIGKHNVMYAQHDEFQLLAPIVKVI